jgi:elongation factor Ts
LILLGRQIAMHIAAASPLALDAQSVDPAVVARERAVLAGKHLGKPAKVVDRIVENGLNTYFKEVCLLDQISTHPEHGGKTIGQTLLDVASRVGATITIPGFYRFALGEGIEKPEGPDFAAEVAGMV